MTEKTVTKIGWFASLMEIIMFSSYIDQIRMNISGQPGSIVLPLATTINGVAWVSQALLKEKKDWPVFACNALAIVLGAVTAVTAL